MFNSNQVIQTFNPEYDYDVLEHDHPKYETTVARAEKLFLDNYVVCLGLSGKDSGAALVCVIEGLRRAIAINPDVGPLYIATTNTGLDNMVLHDYMLTLHDDAEIYAKTHGLPIFTRELNPSLAANPLVEYLGRGKLLRSAKTTSKARDCAYSWKILPMKAFLAEVGAKHQTNKVCSVSGSRDDESAIRAANLKKRNESAERIVATDLGLSQSLIKDWALDDVWSLFRIIDDGDIEAFSDNLNLMKKHYSAGNGGACDLFAKGANSKSCGARFGCVLCCMSKNDDSLEAQISIDPETYGFMKPLNQLRRYMLNTLFDYNHRALVGRQMKEGWVKVGINQYNLEYRANLLRMVLSLQYDCYQKTGNFDISLVDYKELVAIQYHWAREGGESEPGLAFKIWHEVYNEGKFYPIPETVEVEQAFTPEYLYFPLGDYVDYTDSQGLDDDMLYGEHKDAAMVYHRDGVSNQVIRFTESKQLKVVTEGAKAMMFVEEYYLRLRDNGHLTDKCPTVMLKALLESGVIEIPKGSISRLNDDAKRAQTLNSLRNPDGIPVDQLIMARAVPKKIMEQIVQNENAAKAEALQPSLFG